MPNRILSPRLMLSLALAFACIFSMLVVATARPPQRRRASCATVADADIVAAVQAKIKADHRYDGQWTHINVSSQGRVVTLDGYVVGKGAIARLAGYARAVRCVARVRNNLSSYKSAGCGPGQKSCGDICIEEKSECNIIQ